MADFYWVGATSTDSANLSNWVTEMGGSTNPTSAITATDIIYFTHYGVAHCDLANGVTADLIIWVATSDTEVVIDSNRRQQGTKKRFDFDVRLKGGLVCNGMHLDGQIKISDTPTHTANLTILTAPLKSADGRAVPITFGKKGVFSDTLPIIFSISGTYFLEPANYPTIIMKIGDFKSNYAKPTVGTSTEISFNSLDVQGGSFGVSEPLKRMDRKMVFSFRSNGAPTNFLSSIQSLDFGYATIKQAGSTTGNQPLIHNGSDYAGHNGGNIEAKYHAYHLWNNRPQATPFRWLIPAGVIWSINNLTVDANCIIQGAVGTEIHCIALPKVKGTLGNFLQINSGRYRASTNNILSDPLLGTQYGGTGLSALGTAGQVLAVNSGGTVLEWVTGGGGAQGEQGPQGPAGADGADGSNGADGADGAQGPQGLTGPQGPQGLTGAQGIQGATGAAGADGADGADGTNGTNGNNGADGAAGADGATGAQGPQGIQGATGPQGPAGADGADGADGSGSIPSNILKSSAQVDNLATGWWTFAVVKGRDVGYAQRAMAQFYVADTWSGRHRAAHITVGHHYGRDGGNQINLLSVSGYGGGVPFTKFRIVEGNTYDGAALQVYMSNSTNRLKFHMMFNLQTGNGWTLCSDFGAPISNNEIGLHDALLGYRPTATGSGDYVNFAVSMTEKVVLDLEELSGPTYGGGMQTTGSFVADLDFKVSDGLIATDKSHNKVGFFKVTPVEQQATRGIVDLINPPLPPAADPSFDPELESRLAIIESSLNEIILAMTNLGLMG